MGHTPGPWRWQNYPDGRKLLLSRDRAVIHCPDAPIACDEADQTLLAAAPELLDALKGMRALYDGVRDLLISEGVIEKLAVADAAIKKAEGRA